MVKNYGKHNTCDFIRLYLLFHAEYIYGASEKRSFGTSKADLDSILKNTQETPLPHEKDNQQEQSVAVYARVSQPIQKSNGDLNQQVELVKDEAFKRNLCVSGIYTDVRVGTNCWSLLRYRYCILKSRRHSINSARITAERFKYLDA